MKFFATIAAFAATCGLASAGQVQHGISSVSPNTLNLTTLSGTLQDFTINGNFQADTDVVALSLDPTCNASSIVGQAGPSAVAGTSFVITLNLTYTADTILYACYADDYTDPQTLPTWQSQSTDQGNLIAVYITVLRCAAWDCDCHNAWWLLKHHFRPTPPAPYGNGPTPPPYGGVVPPPAPYGGPAQYRRRRYPGGSPMPEFCSTWTPEDWHYLQQWFDDNCNIDRPADSYGSAGNAYGEY